MRLRSAQGFVTGAIMLIAPASLLASDTPLPAPAWEPRQWIGFAVYAALVAALIIVVWRMAGPDLPDPDRPADAPRTSGPTDKPDQAS